MTPDKFSCQVARNYHKSKFRKIFVKYKFKFGLFNFPAQMRMRFGPAKFHFNCSSTSLVLSFSLVSLTEWAGTAENFADLKSLASFDGVIQLETAWHSGCLGKSHILKQSTTKIAFSVRKII